MAWMMLVGIVVAFKCAIFIEASLQTFDVEPNQQKNINTEDANTVPEDAYKAPDLLEDLSLRRLGHHLTEILLHPDQSIPMVYVEDDPPSAAAVGEGSEYFSQFPDSQSQINSEVNEMPFKRSRYYRKYPWKRQNSREAYDAENRYLCQPSREDVFRLLVALHEARQGNSRTVNFCNRRRQATAVFTNIRFLGRRK